MNKKLKKIKDFLIKNEADYFLLPNSDEFFSEYLPNSQKRVESLTNFSGSNAFLIIGKSNSYFFTDSRYSLQAKDQIDLDEFEIIDIIDLSPVKFLQDKNLKLVIDSKLHSVSFFEQLQDSENEIIIVEKNPADLEIEKNRSKIFVIDEKIAGKSVSDKIKEVVANLEADAKIITNPQNLCWLLNIRASDVEYSPLLLAYAILYKNGKIDLFAENNEIEIENVNFIQPNCFDLRISVLKKSIKTIEIDKATTNCWLYNLIKDDFDIIYKKDVISKLKAIKNSAEISGAIKAHEADKKAVTKFINWIENNQNTDEITAQEKLLEFRKEDKNFLYNSFGSISAFGSNGAIVHYQATRETNKKFKKGSLYLIDSGGQYCGDFIGTTDITRTIAIGKPKKEMIEDFTRVLKGHIAIARAKFPRGTTGSQLDILARFHLWQAGKDYGHGTGHGVGSFLSVHEDEAGIHKKANFELKEGMILSNEPGYYKEGEYGIRIENLLLVEKHNENFLKFKTLTKAPIDEKLIDFKMMTYPEKKWLENNN